MINKVTILGRLGIDPELRYTQNQTPVCTISVATTEYSKDKDQEHTEWHNVILWQNNAENANKYLKKGSLVYLEGKIRKRSWEDNTGTVRYATDVVATIIKFLDSKSGNENKSQSSQPVQEDTGNWDDMPKF